MNKERSLLIGIDTGGTFTDFMYQDGNSWKVYKILSTPSDPAEAVLNGIAHIAGFRDVRIVHGSTVATNAILERKGAATALITNKGFEDVIEHFSGCCGLIYIASAVFIKPFDNLCISPHRQCQQG